MATTNGKKLKKLAKEFQRTHGRAMTFDELRIAMRGGK